MRIHFHGAAQTVTGSMYLIEVNGHRLLLECGLYQGRRKDTYDRNLNFPFNPGKIHAVILSHAHIDHSGNLPNLVKQGYNGPIYATSPTAKLADIMLRDSAYIQEQDANYVNKKRHKKGLKYIEPLYTQEDAERTVDYIIPVYYDEKFEPVPGVTAQLVDAGHILGSAAVVLDIKENNRKFRLWFSGDIGRLDLPLLNDPVLPTGADYLIMETTYGDKPHRDPDQAYKEFRAVVKQTIDRGGKVIIPAFSVGRTQELVYNLNRMFSSGDVPPVPVFVDSPLAVNATDIFRQFEHTFDEEAQKFIRRGKHPALWFENLTYTRSVEQSKAINRLKEPVIIISASGMAENGRILHHLRNNIENKRNTICLVSWAAPYTLGRRLAERAEEVHIFGEVFKVKAKIETIGGLSAHAGQKQLLAYARSSEESLKHTFLVHGEPRSSLTLRDLLLDDDYIPDLHYPEINEVFEEW